MMEREAISAAVLTGGASRRMGTDKASIVLGGETLLERAVRTLQCVADDVIIVGDRPAYHDVGVPVIADDYPGAGTLGGIATALRAARHDRVIVVACDMPLLSLSLLRAMASLPVEEEIVVPQRAAVHARQGRGGTYETLHAIYRRACLPHIQKRIENDDLRVIGFFDDVRVWTLDEAWIGRYDPEMNSFRNVNTPDELERVRAVLHMDSE